MFSNAAQPKEGAEGLHRKVPEMHAYSDGGTNWPFGCLA